MGVVSTPAAPLRTLRVAAAYLARGVARGGCERVEERGARVRERVEKSFIFDHWYKKDPKRHADARRAHARSHHLNTDTANQRCGQPLGRGFLRSKKGRQRIREGTRIPEMVVSPLALLARPGGGHGRGGGEYALPGLPQTASWAD